MRSYHILSLCLISSVMAIQADDTLNKNLLAAIKAKHIPLATHFLKKGADGNYADGAPLFAAIDVNSVPLVKLLLDNGAKVNVYERTDNWSDKLSPLMRAAWKGNPKIVKMLLDKGADWRAKVQGSCHDDYCDRRSVIEFADNDEVKKHLTNAEATQRTKDATLVGSIKRGDKQALLKALKSGADVNHCYEDKKCPMEYALIKGDVEIAQLLRSQGANLDYGYSSPAICHAVLSGNPKMVTFVLQAGIDVDGWVNKDNNWQNKRRAIHIAAEQGDLEIAKLLIHHKTHLHALMYETYTPLMAAAKGGNSDMVKLFIAKGADVSEKPKGSTKRALDYASNAQVKDILKGKMNQVEQAKLNTEQKKKTSAKAQADYEKLIENFLSAARDGDIKHFKKIFGQGIDVNVRGKLGQTALIEAVLGGHTDIVTILLEQGADVSAKDNFGKTALCYAQTSDMLALLKG